MSRLARSPSHCHKLPRRPTRASSSSFASWGSLHSAFARAQAAAPETDNPTEAYERFVQELAAPPPHAPTQKQRGAGPSGTYCSRPYILRRLHPDHPPPPTVRYDLARRHTVRLLLQRMLREHPGAVIEALCSSGVEQQTVMDLCGRLLRDAASSQERGSLGGVLDSVQQLDAVKAAFLSQQGSESDSAWRSLEDKGLLSTRHSCAEVERILQSEGNSDSECGEQLKTESERKGALSYLEHLLRERPAELVRALQQGGEQQVVARLLEAVLLLKSNTARGGDGALRHVLDSVDAKALMASLLVLESGGTLSADAAECFRQSTTRHVQTLRVAPKEHASVAGGALPQDSEVNGDGNAVVTGRPATAIDLTPPQLGLILEYAADFAELQKLRRVCVSWYDCAFRPWQHMELSTSSPPDSDSGHMRITSLVVSGAPSSEDWAVHYYGHHEDDPALPGRPVITNQAEMIAHRRNSHDQQPIRTASQAPVTDAPKLFVDPVTQFICSQWASLVALSDSRRAAGYVPIVLTMMLLAKMTDSMPDFQPRDKLHAALEQASLKPAVTKQMFAYLQELSELPSPASMPSMRYVQADQQFMLGVAAGVFDVSRVTDLSVDLATSNPFGTHQHEYFLSHELGVEKHDVCNALLSRFTSLKRLHVRDSSVRGMSWNRFDFRGSSDSKPSAPGDATTAVSFLHKMLRGISLERLDVEGLDTLAHLSLVEKYGKVAGKLPPVKVLAVGSRLHKNDSDFDAYMAVLISSLEATPAEQRPLHIVFDTFHLEPYGSRANLFSMLDALEHAKREQNTPPPVVVRRLRCNHYSYSPLDDRVLQFLQQQAQWANTCNIRSQFDAQQQHRDHTFRSHLSVFQSCFGDADLGEFPPPEAGDILGGVCLQELSWALTKIIRGDSDSDAAVRNIHFEHLRVLELAGSAPLIVPLQSVRNKVASKKTGDVYISRRRNSPFDLVPQSQEAFERGSTYCVWSTEDAVLPQHSERMPPGFRVSKVDRLRMCVVWQHLMYAVHGDTWPVSIKPTAFKPTDAEERAQLVLSPLFNGRIGDIGTLQCCVANADSHYDRDTVLFAPTHINFFLQELARQQSASGDFSGVQRLQVDVIRPDDDQAVRHGRAEPKTVINLVKALSPTLPCHVSNGGQPVDVTDFCRDVHGEGVLQGSGRWTPPGSLADPDEFPEHRDSRLEGSFSTNRAGSAMTSLANFKHMCLDWEQQHGVSLLLAELLLNPASGLEIAERSEGQGERRGTAAKNRARKKRAEERKRLAAAGVRLEEEKPGSGGVQKGNTSRVSVETKQQDGDHQVRATETGGDDTSAQQKRATKKKKKRRQRPSHTDATEITEIVTESLLSGSATIAHSLRAPWQLTSGDATSPTGRSASVEREALERLKKELLNKIGQLGTLLLI